MCVLVQVIHQYLHKVVPRRPCKKHMDVDITLPPKQIIPVQFVTYMCQILIKYGAKY